MLIDAMFARDMYLVYEINDDRLLVTGNGPNGMCWFVGEDVELVRMTDRTRTEGGVSLVCVNIRIMF